MKLFVAALLLFFNFNYLLSQNPLAYQIYNKRGKEVSFDKMINKLSRQDVVLFGELHNDAIVHWLELRTTKALYEKKADKLVLGAEMFERDVQDYIKAYLQDSLQLKTLEENSRPWPNFKTDYLPLLNFAKKKTLKFVATNVPRRYAAIIARHENGIDSLQQLREEQKWMAKLPFKFEPKETPGYREMQEMMKDHAGDLAINYVRAQALKDATMAESILENLKNKETLLHFNGDFHSQNHGGIYWYLKQSKKRLKVVAISIAESVEDNLPLEDDKPVSEFTIVIPSDMTKTY